MRVALVGLLVLCAATVSCGAEPPAWKPESADLLFISNRDGGAGLYLLRAGEQEWTQLNSNANAPVWSPDGTRIAYHSGARDGSVNIWTIKADGTQQTQLTKAKAGPWCHFPWWSPDGKMILFLSSRKEDGDDKDVFATHLYVMQADGSDQRRLMTGPVSRLSRACWSPDGKRIAYSRETSEKSVNIFVADSDGRNERPITSDKDVSQKDPAFSPDGKLLAFNSMSNSASALVVMSVDGTNRRIVLDKTAGFHINWSPDSKWLVYAAIVPERKDIDVYAVPLARDGKPIKLVGTDKLESGASWRPR